MAIERASDQAVPSIMSLAQSPHPLILPWREALRRTIALLKERDKLDKLKVGVQQYSWYLDRWAPKTFSY